MARTGRRFPLRAHITQAPPAAAGASGPPLYPLGRPVQARQLPQQGGRVTRRAGTYAGLGPPVTPPHGPVQARQPLPPRGRTAGRAGARAGLGPPLKAPAGPARGQPAVPVLTGRGPRTLSR